MDWLQWLFLESQVALGILLFAITFFALVFWRRGGSRYVFLATLGAAIILLITQSAITTQREHASRIMRAIERDIINSNTGAIAAGLDPSFHIPETDWDRERFIRIIERMYEDIDVRTINRRRFERVTSEPDRFVMAASYYATVTGTQARTIVSRWQIEFVRSAHTGWRVSTISPVWLNGFEFRKGWRDLTDWVDIR